MSEFPARREQAHVVLDEVGPFAEDTMPPLRQLEISHYEQVDTVLNYDAVLAQQWGPTLRDTFRNGIPPLWKVIGGGGRNVMMGGVDGKKFVAKLRNKRLIEGDAQITPEQWRSTFIAPRRQVYAGESIINEMRLAPMIKAALATDEAQQNIRQAGFGGISLIEPILGVISRSPNGDLPYSNHLFEQPTTDKYLLYEYIEGVAPAIAQGRALKEIVETALWKAGINTKQGDLHPDHFIIDATNRAHLLDTELYTVLSSEQSKTSRD